MEEAGHTTTDRALQRWEWFKTKAQTKSAYWWLGVYSFFETIIIPFPTDPFLAVMVHAHRARAVWITVWTTVTSLAAALVGYVIAYAAYETVGQPLIASLGIESAVLQVAETFNTYTFLATFIGAFSPVPFAPIIFAAGLLKANVFVFIVATLLGRGLRFGAVSAVTVFFGVSILPKLGAAAMRITIALAVLALAMLGVFILF